MKTNFTSFSTLPAPQLRWGLMYAVLGTIFSVNIMLSQSQNWWRTNGNTPQNSDYLGTSNNAPLIIKTNSIERIRVAPNGFVGIGNSNPQYILDVSGRTKLRYNVYCDSLLQTSNLIVNYSIQTSTIDAHQYLLNGQPAVFSQWTSISPSAIAFNGDVYVNTLNAQSGISIGNFKFKNGALPPQRDTIKSDRMVSIVADKSIEFKADTVRFADRVGIGKQPAGNVALDVNGDVAVSGGLKVGNLQPLQDSIMKVVVVDNNGNLKTLGGPGNPPPGICPTQISAPYWYVGGNKLSATGCNYIGSANAVDFSVISGGVPRINLSADGRIGIGIAPPPAAQNLVDPVKYEFNGSVSIRNDGNAGLFFGRDNIPNSSAVAYYYGEWGIQYVKSVDNGGNGGGLNFWKPYQSTGVNGNGFLWLGDNGNVGIGTTTPIYKLEVCGTIRSKEWIVETGWCDFVFEPTYQRMNWKDKKAYHEKHKHLPYLPSQNEIEKMGFSSQYIKGIVQNIEEDRLDIEDLYKKCEEISKQYNLIIDELKMIKNKLSKLKEENLSNE